MLKKKLLIPLAFGLILTMTACTANDEDVDPDVDTPPAVEDEVPEDDMPDEDMPGEDGDEVTP